MIAIVLHEEAVEGREYVDAAQVDTPATRLQRVNAVLEQDADLREVAARTRNGGGRILL